MYKIVSFVIGALFVAAACGVDDNTRPVAVESAESIEGTAPTETEPVEETDPVATATSEPPSDTGDPERPATTVDEAADEAGDPDVGATTLNDPYVGDFGNGGYDVASYDLALDWDPDSERLDGEAMITASATHDLIEFNLELTGFEVASVDVDGAAAEFRRNEDEMTISLSEEISNGDEFTTTVVYAGTPVDNEFIAGDVGRPSGWHTRDGFAYVAGEPLSASTFHPANDHPSDKASFTYRITAPSDLTVAASGTLDDTTVDGEQITWTFSQPEPQATYLTTILIGDFTVIDDATSESGVPVRNVIDSTVVEQVESVFDLQPEMIDAFEELFGPYPFEVSALPSSTTRSVGRSRPRPCRSSVQTSSAMATPSRSLPTSSFTSGSATVCPSNGGRTSG